MLSADRRERLEALDGWVWDALAAAWEEGFTQLTAYVQAEGSARVPGRYRTTEDYPLGQWVGVQRSTKDSISADRRRRLETLKGWVWDANAAAWEEGFAQLTAYVQAEGSARVPGRYRTAEGYRLGGWVIEQRSTKDALSADRRQRLEAVKGWMWNTLAAAWEEGFAVLAAYVEAEGHALIPAKYRTAEGYRLGGWVTTQRTKKDAMPAERRRRLEALDGWVWVVRSSKHRRKKP